MLPQTKNQKNKLLSGNCRCFYLSSVMNLLRGYGGLNENVPHRLMYLDT